MAILPLTIWVSWPGRASLGRRRWLGTVGLRCGVFIALIVTLAEPQYVRQSDGVTVIFALDRSRSIPDDLRSQTEQYVKQVAQKAHPGDKIGVVGFDGRAQVDFLPNHPDIASLTFGMATDPDRTDPAAAIRMAMAMFPPDTARRVVLLTDGNENSGSVLSEVESAAANAAVVDVVPLEYAVKDEMLLDRLVVPAHVSPNSRVHLRLVARSLRPAHGKLSLYYNDTAVPLSDPMIQLNGGMRPEVLTIPIELRSSGVHRFDVRLSPDADSRDTIAENNRAMAFTIVQSRGRALVLDPVGSLDNRPLAEALEREKVEVDYRHLDELPLDLVHLQQYAAVVLGNISADRFTDEQHRALANYVKDLGGGLILMGGNEAFAAGGWTGRPIEEVSPVSFAISDEKTLPVAAMVIVLDHSGSMSSPVAGSSRTQQQVANEAAILALKTLLPQDYSGLVAFDTESTWVVSLQANANPTSVAARIRSIGPSGGTNAFPALETATAALEKIGRAASIKHVLLLTDGQTQPAPFEPLVERMVQNGITLSTIGVGDGMNDPLLRQLAQVGGGTFHPVRDPNTLPQVFFRETRIIRNRLIQEKPFKPQAAGSSRDLLGGIADEAWPELGGFVQTQLKNDALVALTHSDEGKTVPILAYWQYQMGKVIAFTSGWWPHWGKKWVSWPAFGGFWKNAVEWVGRGREAQGLDVTVRQEGTSGRVVVEAIGRDGTYLNGLDIRGVLIPPGGNSKNIYLMQTGAGQYQAPFNAQESGDYLVNLQVHGSSEAAGTVCTGMTVSYSPEYRELHANQSLLEKVVEKAKGKIRWLSASQDNPFERDLPPVRSQRPIWQWMLGWCLLPLFLMDVAVRRLASLPALSVYIEAGILIMLVGCVRLMGAGAVGYVAALVLAEVVGWSLRWRWLQAALQSFLATAHRPVATSAGMLTVLRGTRQQVRDALDSRHSTEPLAKRTQTVDRLQDVDRQSDDHADQSEEAKTLESVFDEQPAESPVEKKSISSEETAQQLLRVKKNMRRKLGG